jgi:DNA-directed RNA polymerase subunit RPC12/RpoP
MSASHVVKCAKCKVPLEGPVDTRPDSLIACPSCGTGDTRENVEREVAEYVASGVAQALDAMVEGFAQGLGQSSSLEGPRAQRIYRFIIDEEA